MRYLVAVKILQPIDYVLTECIPVGFIQLKMWVGQEFVNILPPCVLEHDAYDFQIIANTTIEATKVWMRKLPEKKNT